MNSRRPCLAGEHQADSGRADQVHGAICQHVQEFEQIELVYESVGDLDEDRRQTVSRGNGSHACLLPASGVVLHRHLSRMVLDHALRPEQFCAGTDPFGQGVTGGTNCRL